MSNIRSTVEYGAMGVGTTLILWAILAFFPTIMVSLSLVDTFFDWDESKIYDHGVKELVPYNSKIHAIAGDSGVLVQTNNGEFGKACVTFCVLFLIIGAIQGGMVANIRQAWGIVIPWFIISIYPAIKWLSWFGSSSDVPFPGVDWFPW